MIIAAVLEIGLLLVLPQLAGLLVTRLVRRASWPVWPAAAISVFGVGWYLLMWVPARDAAAHADTACGMWVVALTVGLLFGLSFHLAVGVGLGLLARRLRRPARQQTPRDVA